MSPAPCGREDPGGTVVGQAAEDDAVATQGGSFDWRGELWRSLTRPRLQWAWLAIAVAAAVPTLACAWILVVNLPAALDGQVAGARALQWAMVLCTLLGGITASTTWRLYWHARANGQEAS